MPRSVALPPPFHDHHHHANTHTHVHAKAVLQLKAMKTTHANAVRVQDQATKQPKIILHGVQGEAKPGHLLAIMGASGAGKSTLVGPCLLLWEGLGRRQGTPKIERGRRNPVTHVTDMSCNLPSPCPSHSWMCWPVCTTALAWRWTGRSWWVGKGGSSLFPLLCMSALGREC